MDWLFDQFDALKPKVKAMQGALVDFFNRKGCTNPAAGNYDSQALVDDGSCIFGCVVNTGVYIGTLKYIHQSIQCQCDTTANLSIDTNKSYIGLKTFQLQFS